MAACVSFLSSLDDWIAVIKSEVLFLVMQYAIHVRFIENHFSSYFYPVAEVNSFFFFLPSFLIRFFLKKHSPQHTPDDTKG